MEIYRFSEKNFENQNKSGDFVAKILEITDMRPAVRNENRVNIYVNGKFSFSLDITQVVEYGVKIGRKLSETELTELKTASEFGKLYQSTLEWVLMRPHSAKEVREYLKKRQMKRRMENRKREMNRERLKENPELRKRQADLKIRTKELMEITDENIEKVFQRLKDRGYICDQKFAEYYIENRFVNKGISRRRLEMELMRKGVAKDIIEEALGGRNEQEELKKMLEKKRKKYQEDEKLIAYLVRQGFQYQLVREMVQSYEKD